MAIITILPEAAALAGCGITTDIIASGAWPITEIPGEESGYWYCNGSYTQRSITAAFAGRWRSCNIVVTNRHYGTERWKRGGGQPGYIETPFDFASSTTIQLYDHSDTFTPPSLADESPPQSVAFPANRMAAGSYDWAWSGSSAEEALAKNDGTIEIVSIVATFIKSPLPSGPILCKTDGVMICNHSGELLYN